MAKKIKVVSHRGADCLRVYIDGKPRYRVLRKDVSVERQIGALEAELEANGGRLAPQKRKQQNGAKKTIAQYINDDWYQDVLTEASVKHAGLTRLRAERTFEEAALTDIEKITLAKTRTALHRLRCSARDPKKKQEDYALLSEQSRKHYARCCKQFTAWLVREGHLKKDPLKGWKLKADVEERCRRDRLQPEELSELVQETRKSTRIVEDYDGVLRSWLYVLAAMTGLRRGELASLTPESFDWGGRTVVVEAAYTKDSKKAVQPLNKAMIPDLKKWVAGKSGILFPGLADKRTTKMMEVDLATAGLPFRTETGSRCFHCLRNTYISSLFDIGLSVAQVQRLARHKDVRQTMKYGKPKSDEQTLVDGLEYPGVEDPPQEPT